MVVYVVCVALLYMTRNPNLFPTVVLVGSFLVPTAYVSYFYERRHLSRISVPLVARAFAYGGLLGVISASVLEPLLLGPLGVAGLAIGVILGVGLIEEAAKTLGLLATVLPAGYAVIVSEVAVGAAGLIILWLRWREAVHLQLAAATLRLGRPPSEGAAPTAATPPRA